MNLAILLSTAAVLAFSASAASAAHMKPAPVHHGFAKHIAVHGNKHLVTLYDQNGNDDGAAVVSDNFDSAFDSYDSQAADDFVVPSLHQWIIKEVDVTGTYFNGYGPADGVTVYFYRDNAGLPGDLVQEVDGSEVTDTNGSFSIKLEDAVSLKAGTYWISVQANMNFSGGAGEWGWEVNSVQTGNQSAWQNPGNGSGTGCTTWTATETCLGVGPDLMFSLVGMDHLKKKDVGGDDQD